MSNTFSLLFGKILRSSIWVQESKETRLVWVAILALKDRYGLVESSVIGLADSAKVTVEECRAALEVLTSPDPNDTSGVENGVRLKVVPGKGWQVVNHDLYRFSNEAQRAVNAERQANYRKRRNRKETQVPNGANEKTPEEELLEERERQEAVSRGYPRDPEVGLSIRKGLTTCKVCGRPVAEPGNGCAGLHAIEEETK